MPTETMPKEALTDLDVERKLSEFNIPHEFVEKYGLELALLYCQPKIDAKVIYEKLGLKLDGDYSFPELENSNINRAAFADSVQCEGGVYIRRIEEDKAHDKIYRYLRPSIQFTNTSKELAEKISANMNRPLPKPRIYPNPLHTPAYLVTRGCTPAIYLTVLIRPYLRKREAVENADKIIEMFKEKPSIRCDENWNPISRPEPKFMKALKLRQKGMHDKEIAKMLGVNETTVSTLIFYAKHPEIYRERRRDYYHRKK